MDDDDFAEHNKKHSPDSDSFDDLPTSLIGEHLTKRVELLLLQLYRCYMLYQYRFSFGI